MALAENGAIADLNSSWQEKRLPDNFPKLVLTNIPQLPKEMVAAYREEVANGKTGWLDLHPSDRERIARATIEEPGDGIFHLAGRGTDVFGNFDAMAKVLTLELYKSNLGPEITKDQLYPVAELVETQAVAQEGGAALERFFLGAFGLMTVRPSLSLDYPRIPAEPAAAKRALVEARNQLQAARGSTVQANLRVDEVWRRLCKAEYAVIAAKTGVTVDLSELGVKTGTSRAIETARDRVQCELDQIVEDCGPFAAAATRRLTEAIAILEADPVADRIEAGRDRREEARALYTCVAHLGRTYGPQVTRLMLRRTTLIELIQAFQAARNPGQGPLRDALFRASGNLAECLEEFRWKLGDRIIYPFEHAQEDTTLARYAFPVATPDRNDIGAVLELSEGALARLIALTPAPSAGSSSPRSRSKARSDSPRSRRNSHRTDLFKPPRHCAARSDPTTRTAESQAGCAETPFRALVDRISGLESRRPGRARPEPRCPRTPH